MVLITPSLKISAVLLTETAPAVPASGQLGSRGQGGPTASDQRPRSADAPRPAARRRQRRARDGIVVEKLPAGEVSRTRYPCMVGGAGQTFVRIPECCSNIPRCEMRMPKHPVCGMRMSKRSVRPYWANTRPSVFYTQCRSIIPSIENSDDKMSPACK